MDAEFKSCPQFANHFQQTRKLPPRRVLDVGVHVDELLGRLQRRVGVLEGQVEEEGAVAGVGGVVPDEAGRVVGEDVL